jgi:hypothetical protein
LSIAPNATERGKSRGYLSLACLRMSRKRVHLLSTVNASNVSKTGGTYTIRDVCGAIDEIVMNGMLYPGDQLATGAPTLNHKPAPAGHPKNAAGQFISAVNGEALLSAYIGSVCTNARHVSGRTLVDIVVNEAQARASDAGKSLIERLDAAIANTNSEPINVSTGLFCEVVNASGESRGKKYSRIATNIAYDHLAILLNEKGAGTPEEGVGMFLNAAGEAEPVEAGAISTEPEDKRSAGLMAWVKRLIGNGSADVSFDQITSGLYALMADGCWIREVFDRYAIWSDRDGRLWRQDYAVSSEGSVAFSGTAVEVIRKVEYQTVTTNRKEDDPMKDKILAALNAAGIKTDGLDEAQLLTAYNALVAKPVEDKLTAANSKIAEHEAAARAAEEAEASTLATELAVNSTLTVDDLKKLGAARLRELKAKAAPVLPGNGGAKPGDEFAGYSLNSHLEEKK